MATEEAVSRGRVSAKAMRYKIHKDDKVAKVSTPIFPWEATRRVSRGNVFAVEDDGPDGNQAGRQLQRSMLLLSPLATSPLAASSMGHEPPYL